MSRFSTPLLACLACAASVTLRVSDASAQVGPIPPPWWPPFVIVFPGTMPRPAPPQAAPRPSPAPAPPPLAQPREASDAWPRDWARMEDEVLVLTNQRRAQGAVCGGKTYAPAGPLTADPVLRVAAREHSRDMGAGNYFEHVSLDGRSPTDRMHAAGWSGRMGGENIYGGERNGGTLSAAEVVEGWMQSPGHCSNIMEPRFRTIGVGYASAPHSRLGNYWTQDFGG